MAMDLKLSQKLTQTLAMTPQLRQAIELLQLGRQDYLEVIEQELLKNPLLEKVGDSEPQSADSKATNGEAQTSSEAKEDPNLQKPLRDEDFYEDNSSFAKTRKSNFDSDELPSLEATLTYPEDLSTHLLAQLRTHDLSQGELEIASNVIGNVDSNGYLATTTSELAQACNCPEEEVLEVLWVVQSLDPAGIAARDLRECLLIQISQSQHAGTLVEKVVQDHLNELEFKRYPQLAKKLGVAVEEIYEVLKTIRSFEPRPGRPFSSEAPVYIVPDVYIKNVEGDYVVLLNDTGVPKLKVNDSYRNFVEGGNNTEHKGYINEHMRLATGLIRSIHRRQQTIFKVTESIVKYQRGFLEEGPRSLKPLVLREVAEDVGMHESTISRVTTNKYVHTPQGVFELKFFFSSGLKNNYGSISSESVKERIRELIAGEDPKKPLSDQAIMAVFKSEGINVARRTIAKYRESMGILASSRRKKPF